MYTKLSVHSISKMSVNQTNLIGCKIFSENHDVFLLQRKDETSQVFASLSHRFREHWQFRAQLAVVDQESSLQTYEYERTVLNVGFSRDFWGSGARRYTELPKGGHSGADGRGPAGG